MFYCPEDGHGLPHDPFKAIVAPRPIGWISSLSPDGAANLAPYSFFNGCGDAPPLVMFSQTGRKSRPELWKDSIANIRENREFAANVVGRELAEKMNISSGTYEADIDEFSLAGLTKADCRQIAAPRVAEAPAAMECRVVKIIDDLPTWRDHARNVIIIGEVVGVHIDDQYIVDGKLDLIRYQPVARLGYMDYTSVNEIFSMERP